MTLSQTLLGIAVLGAVLPIASLRGSPPTSIRDLEKSFVVGVVTVLVTTGIAWRIHDLHFFGLTHLLYLLVVVTIPALLLGWWALARIRGTSTLLLRIGAALGTVIALCGVWGTHIEPNWLRTDVVAVNASINAPITVGVLADLQTPNVGKHEWNAVDTLIAQNPDLVLVPGDLFQGPPQQIAAETPNFISLLEALVASSDVVAVVSGDSDWVGQLKPMVEAAGALFIDNQITELVVNDTPIRLAGVTVASNASERLATLAAVSQPSDAFTILLAHRPDVVYEIAPTADVDLIVSGHTHGGQIQVPFIGPLVTFSDVPRSLAAGGIEVIRNHAVYVSPGVGMERLDAPQIRFGARPEVGVLHLTPAS